MQLSAAIYMRLFVLGILIASCSNRTREVATIVEDAGTDQNDQSFSDLDSSSEPDVVDELDIDNDSDIVAPDYWDQITNRCADVTPNFLPEPQGEILPPPVNLTAALAWQRSELCPGEFPGALDLDSTPGTLAMGEYEGKTIVFEAFETPFAPLSGYGVRAIARIDPVSGASLGCLTTESVSGVMAPPMHIDPRAGDSPLVVLRTYQDGGTFETAPVMSWWSSTWQTEERLPIPVSDETVTPETYLLPDGQLLILLDGHRLASVDSTSGSVNWVVRPSDVQQVLGLPYPLQSGMSRYRTVFDPVTRTVHMQVRSAKNTADGQGGNISITHCGVVEESSIDSIKTTLPFGDGFLEVSPGENGYRLRSLDSGGTVTRTIPNCENVVSLENNRVACINISNQDRTLTLSVLKWPDDMEVFALEEPLTPDGKRVVFMSNAIALRERLIVVQSRHFDSDFSNRSQKLRFIDWTTGEVVTDIDVPVPVVEQGWSSSREPVIDEHGNLVISMYGYLFGIATNTTGLSPTRFPRGFYLGGNRNLGAR